MDYLLCGNLPYPAWKKHISVQNLSNRRIRRYLVCRLKRPEARDFSHVRFTDCKYGVSVENGRIWLSLHKGGCCPDYRGDKGIHECTYALLPHNSGFGAEAVVQPAYELNIAPIVMPGRKDMESFVTVDVPNVIVEAVKPMEDGNGYAMRLYEAEGTSVRTKIHLTETGEKVMLTNLLEEEIETLPDEKEIALEFKPFEIKTICVSMNE